MCPRVTVRNEEVTSLELPGVCVGSVVFPRGGAIVCFSLMSESKEQDDRKMMVREIRSSEGTRLLSPSSRGRLQRNTDS